MAGVTNPGPPRRVALTGPTGSLGALLLPRLIADEGVESVLTLGLRAPPPENSGKVSFQTLDLSRPDAEGTLTAALTDGKIDALFHLALLLGPIHDPALAHELEVVGTLQVLSAVSRAQVARLILPSFTMLYGARGEKPAVLPETATLHGCPASRFVTDRVRVEQEVALFAERHPGTLVRVLRFAPVLGRTVDNPATRLLRRAVVPTLLGFDPLWQCLHEEDAGAALHLALRGAKGGPFNIVGRGTLPLSAVIHEAGSQSLPLPTPLARAALRALNGLGVTSVPLNLLDYFRYSWVADGEKARQGLGFTPRYNTREAAASIRGS